MEHGYQHGSAPLLSTEGGGKNLKSFNPFITWLVPLVNVFYCEHTNNDLSRTKMLLSGNFKDVRALRQYPGVKMYMLEQKISPYKAFNS